MGVSTNFSQKNLLKKFTCLLDARKEKITKEIQELEKLKNSLPDFSSVEFNNCVKSIGEKNQTLDDIACIKTVIKPGQCSGFSLLFGLYSLQGQSTIFFNFLSNIANLTEEKIKNGEYDESNFDAILGQVVFAQNYHDDMLYKRKQFSIIQWMRSAWSEVDYNIKRHNDYIFLADFFGVEIEESPLTVIPYNEHLREELSKNIDKIEPGKVMMIDFFSENWAHAMSIYAIDDNNSTERNFYFYDPNATEGEEILSSLQITKRIDEEYNKYNRGVEVWYKIISQKKYEEINDQNIENILSSINSDDFLSLRINFYDLFKYLIENNRDDEVKYIVNEVFKKSKKLYQEDLVKMKKILESYIKICQDKSIETNLETEARIRLIQSKIDDIRDKYRNKYFHNKMSEIFWGLKNGEWKNLKTEIEYALNFLNTNIGRKIFKQLSYTANEMDSISELDDLKEIIDRINVPMDNFKPLKDAIEERKLLLKNETVFERVVRIVLKKVIFAKNWIIDFFLKPFQKKKLRRT